MYRLCKFQKKKYNNKINITIVTLIENGFFEPKLRKMGVKIFSLKINKEDKIFNLFKKILYYENILHIKIQILFKAGCITQIFLHFFISKKFYDRIFWNIRHSELNFKISKKLLFFYH